MRKRLLSLFLAVCTVLLSIPMAVFPVFAASASDSETIVLHSTRFAPDEPSTWPIFGEYDINSMNVSEYVSATYPDAWQIGGKATAGAANNFTPYDRLYKADGSSMILSSSTAYWSTTGGMYMNSSSMKYTMFSGMNYNTDRTAVDSHNADPTIRYTAEMSGTVEIDLTELYMYAEKTAYFEIYHNGQRLVDSFLADNNSYYYINAANTIHIVQTAVNVGSSIGKITVENVKQGDTFDFVSRGNDDFNATNYPDHDFTVDFEGDTYYPSYHRTKRGVYDFDIKIDYVAQKQSYTTRFAPDETSTWPIVPAYNIANLENLTALPVTYQGNWEIGYTDPAGEATNFTPYSSLIKMDSSNMILTMGSTAWDDWGGMYMNTGATSNLMFSGMKYDKNNWTLTSHTADPVIRYTAEYTGTAIIRINDLRFYADNTASFEVLHNGNSLTGEYVANHSLNRISTDATWYQSSAQNVASDLNLLIVELTAGDTIDFVSRGNDDYVAANAADFGLNQFADAEYNYAKRGVYTFDFEINYLGDKDSSTTESWTGGNATVNSTLPQSLFTWKHADGSLVGNGGTLESTDYAVINPALIESGDITATSNFATTLAEYKVYLKKFTSIDYTGNWSLGAIVDGGYHDINRLGFVSERTVYAVGLNSDGYPQSGRPLTGKTNYNWDTQYWTYQDYAEKAIDYYISHATITPGSGTTAADIKLAYTQFTEDTKLSVSNTPPFGTTEAGIKYTNNLLHLRPGSSGKMGAFGYTVPANVDLGILSFNVSNLSFAEGSSFRYAIAVNGEVVYPVGASLTTTSANTAAGSNGAWAVCTSLSDLQSAVNKLKLEVTGGDLVEICVARNSGGVSVNLGVTATVDNYHTVCGLDFVQAGDRLYSKLVPFGETVTVSSLGLPNDFGINGVYMNNNSSTEALPSTITMNSNIKVTDYTMDTSVSFSIDSAFAFNVYVKARNTASEAGIIVDGVKYAGNSLGNGMYKYTLGGIAPKDIPTKKLTYRAYETVNGKDIVSPKAITVNAKDLLAAYQASSDVTLAALAKVILNYSLAARDHLVNKTVTLDTVVKNALRGRSTSSSSETGTVDAALLAMVADYQAGTAYQSYADGVDPDSYLYKFNGASLVLEDRLAFVFRVKRTNGNAFGVGETGYRIRIQDENGEILRYVAADGYFDSTNKELLYYADNIPASEYARPLYFTLVDSNNNAISATLQYSVHAFLARMHDTTNGDAGVIHYLFRGIYQFGEATQAYIEAHSLNYDEDIVFEVGNAGDQLEATSFPLIAPSYNATGATGITGASFATLTPAAGTVYKVTDGNAATLTGLTSNKDYSAAVLIAPKGLVIKDLSNVTISQLIVEGPVRIENCTNLTLKNVKIQAPGDTAITIDGQSTGTALHAIRATGNVAISNAGTDTVLLSSYLGFTAYGVQDTAERGTILQDSRLEGEGVAISTVASGSTFRFLTVKMNSIADTGIVITGGQNILVAQNVISGTRSSIDVSGADNCSIVLNSAVSIDADGNTHMYICDNALGGRLTVMNNDYLLADGNTFPVDTKDHNSVQSNNKNTNGNSLMNVDARLDVGADEDLLPHTDKDLFVGMERQETVTDVSLSTSYSIYDYVERQALANEYVVIAPGAYVASGENNQHATINLSNKHNNTTIYAYGVYAETPLLPGKEATETEDAKTSAHRSLTTHISVSGASDITFKGLTVGSVMQSSGQVYVLERLGSNRIRVIGGAGMMNEFSNTNTEYYDTTGFYLHRVSQGEFSVFCDLGMKSISKQADGTMIMTVNADAYELISKGDVLTCRANGGATSVSTSTSSNIRYQDMVIYGTSGGLCFVENRNETAVTYYRIADTNRNGAVISADEYNKYKTLEAQYDVDFEMSIDAQGRYRGSVAHIGSIDATHTNSSQQGSQVISCLFENMCDDGTNQKSVHARLASAVDNGDGTTTITYKGNLSPVQYGSYKNYESSALCQPFKVGDRVLIYTAGGQLVCDTTALTATVDLDSVNSTYVPENLTEEELAAFIPAAIPYRKITVATEAVNFDALDGYTLSDDSYYENRKVLVDNLSKASNGFLFDNTVIDGTRSRGLLIKSGDGVIRNCTIRNVAKVAVACILEIYWGESSITERLIVENNLIDNVSYSPKPNSIYQHNPIYIGGLGGGTVDADHLLYNNITISGNKILNNHAANAVFVRAARDLYIYNNDFGASLKETASAPTASLYLDGVANVELSGNIYSPYITDVTEAVDGTVYSNLFGLDYGTYPYHDANGTLHIRYQDSFTFPYDVTAIDQVVITSKVSGTNTKDENLLLLREDGKTIYADGCGTAVVHLANGRAVNVVVEASAINLFFVTGQSNASGDAQSGLLPGFSSQYTNDYIRSPETMSYFSWCGQTMSIDPEGDLVLYEQAIAEDGKALWHTAADVAAGKKMPNFTDYRLNIPTTLDWETASVQNGCQPQQFSFPKGSTSFGNAGWCAALAYEWVQQTGERVWIVNASQGGMEIQHFLPSADGSVTNNEYYQAVAVFNLALETLYKEVDAGHFYLNHMAYYWFHGESNSSITEKNRGGEYTGWTNRFKADRGNRYLEAEEYTEYFTRMHEGFMKDVKYTHNGITKELEYCGIMTVRTKVDEGANSFEQIVLNGARNSQYYMGGVAEGSLSNVYVVSNVTERWVGQNYTTTNGTDASGNSIKVYNNPEADAAVEAYFLETYGSAEAFEKIFGYAMPTTVYEIHPGVHYLMHGHNEMGMDCARNTLRIINARGVGKTYPYIDYAESNGYTITLVGEDGHTPYTDTIVFSPNGTVVVPKIDPIWQGWQGVELVAETEGFYFDNFKLYRTDDTKRFVTFSLYVNGQKVKTYTLGEKIVSSFLDYTPLYNKNSDGTYTFNGMRAPWSAGLVRFNDGSFHAYDTISKSGLLYHSTIGKSEHNDYGSFFVGSWKASLQNNQNGVAALCYTAEADGNIAVSAKDFNAVNYPGGGGVFLAILKNGEMVWPTAGGKLDWDKDDWYFSAVGETEADLNELWATLKITVNEGDLIEFCLGGDRGKADSQCITNSQSNLIPVIEYVE